MAIPHVSVLACVSCLPGSMLAIPMSDPATSTYNMGVVTDPCPSSPGILSVPRSNCVQHGLCERVTFL